MCLCECVCHVGTCVCACMSLRLNAYFKSTTTHAGYPCRAVRSSKTDPLGHKVRDTRRPRARARARLARRAARRGIKMPGGAGDEDETA